MDTDIALFCTINKSKKCGNSLVLLFQISHLLCQIMVEFCAGFYPKTRISSGYDVVQYYLQYRFEHIMVHYYTTGKNKGN